MHWSGMDDINTRVPPDVFHDAPGWAYGAFLMQRFTHWDARSHELSLAYLMSTSTPYQAQVMRTKVRLPVPLTDLLGQLVGHGIDYSVRQGVMKQWMDDRADYPVIAQALLKMLNGKGLIRPVYLDVIVWNYEHADGLTVPGGAEEVDLTRLKTAVLEGYTKRYGATTTDFEAITR
jgi:hypothetical protein